jgi:large subunit ribosomal protein L1
MAKHGKRYLELLKKIDRQKLYEPREAVRLLKELASARFDETVEVHVRTGLDVRHADQMVRGATVLPAGTGTHVRLLVFAAGEKAREAEEAGADYVGADDLVKRIQEGWLDFDVAIATPDMMGQLELGKKLGKVLGPRGLMPNPRTGTVTMDVARAVREAKGGRVEFRVDKTGVVHAPIGKVSFKEEDLLANLAAFMDALLRAKPSGAKGQYIRSVTLSTTMGPGVRLDVLQVQALAQAA